MSQASATLFKASGSAADPKAKSAQATLRQLSFLIPNQRISENCTNLIDSQPVNEDTVDEDVVDEDTDVGLADDDTVDEDTFNTISDGLAYTETNLLKPPRNDFKDLSVYDDNISSAPVQSKNCTKKQNYIPLDVASSGSSSCSSSGSSSSVNINATNASRKRQSSLPIDELVESSSQLIKLATTRMSSSSEPQSDPMVSSFAYKIKKIKDIRTRKMLELQIDRLINDSLLSYYDEFGFDE